MGQQSKLEPLLSRRQGRLASHFPTPSLHYLFSTDFRRVTRPAQELAEIVDGEDVAKLLHLEIAKLDQLGYPPESEGSGQFLVIQVVDLQLKFLLEVERSEHAVDRLEIAGGAVLAVLGVEVDELALLEGVVLSGDLGELGLRHVRAVGLSREDVTDQLLLRKALQVLEQLLGLVPVPAVVFPQLPALLRQDPAAHLPGHHRGQMVVQPRRRPHVEHLARRPLHAVQDWQSFLLQHHRCPSRRSPQPADDAVQHQSGIALFDQPLLEQELLLVEEGE